MTRAMSVRGVFENLHIKVVKGFDLNHIRVRAASQPHVFYIHFKRDKVAQNIVWALNIRMGYCISRNL